MRPRLRLRGTEPFKILKQKGRVKLALPFFVCAFEFVIIGIIKSPVLRTCRCNKYCLFYLVLPVFNRNDISFAIQDFNR